MAEYLNDLFAMNGTTDEKVAATVLRVGTRFSGSPQSTFGMMTSSATARMNSVSMPQPRIGHLNARLPMK